MRDHTRRQHWLGASLAALVLAGSAQPVLAQDAAADETASTEDGDALTVIYVTPNRREENIQDVAVSVATLPEEQLARIFSTGAEVTALAARVPGLFVESSNGRVTIRVANRGTVPAPATWVRMVLHGPVQGGYTYRQPCLAPGESKPVVFDVGNPLAGVHYTVHVDAAREIAESNETNNVVSGNF
jgi:subtilase family serine protease